MNVQIVELSENTPKIENRIFLFKFFFHTVQKQFKMNVQKIKSKIGSIYGQFFMFKQKSKLNSHKTYKYTAQILIFISLPQKILLDLNVQILLKHFHQYKKNGHNVQLFIFFFQSTFIKYVQNFVQILSTTPKNRYAMQYSKINFFAFF